MLSDNHEKTITIDGEKSDSHFIYQSDYLKDEFQDEIRRVRLDEIRNHSLGGEVAKRMYLLEEMYTYETEPVPGAFSGKRIVKKPEIYNSITRIEKHIRKQVRKGRVSEQTGSMELSQYLEFALAIRYEDTKSFETALKKADNIEELIATYNMIKLQ
jgi:hypothetical protein